MNKKTKQLLIHIALFVVTVVTTTIAGTEWMYSKFLFWVSGDAQMHWPDFVSGFHFSIPFLLILTVHEFGHYFTARFHDIRVTLPYYIPMWLGFLLSPSFGTMGAFIKIKDPIYSLKHYFDVGISGPLAGFVVAVGVIFYGYTHLPDPEQIFEIHPEYAQYGTDYPEHVYTYEFSRMQDSLRYVDKRAKDSVAFVAEHSGESFTYPAFQPMGSYPSIYFGKPLLFFLVEKYCVSDKSKIPPKQEIMHNPYLLAGLLALFFTALNLLPIGQLDGGHILFGLIGGKRHGYVSKALFTALLFYAGLGVISMADLHDIGVDSSLSFLASMGVYLYFLYVCAFSMFREKRNRMLYAAVLFSVQFLVHTFFGLDGYSGWLLFALLLGRFLGVVHPPVLDNRPLTVGRQVLGWIALLVFVLCFSPEPFVMSV